MTFFSRFYTKLKFYLKLLSVLADIDEAHVAIERLLLVQAALATIFLVCILLYLPERPHNAPSVAAAAGRHSFVRGVRLLTRYF